MPTSSTLEQQNVVIKALASGLSVSAAAELAEIDRGSPYDWLRKDASFSERLNEARQIQRNAIRTYLKELVPAALAKFESLLSDVDVPHAVQFRVSATILKSAGLLNPESDAEDRRRIVAVGPIRDIVWEERA